MIDQKKRYLGNFATDEEAAVQYDRYAFLQHGLRVRSRGRAILTTVTVALLRRRRLISRTLRLKFTNSSKRNSTLTKGTLFLHEIFSPLLFA